MNKPTDEQLNAETCVENAGEGDAESSETVSAESQELSEAELDHQDVTPEAIRRGRILIGVILVLLVSAIAMIVIAPPLGWQPAKRQMSNYRLPGAVVVMDSGSSDALALSYAPVTEVVDYHLDIEQKTDYEGHSTAAELHADVQMRPVLDSGDPHRIMLKVHGVDAHITDDGSEVSLASAGSMLSGISLFSVLDERRGIGTVVPDANINPQVGRVLYTMLDAVRLLWTALPDGNVGTGAVWEGRGMSDGEGKFFTEFRNTLSLAGGKPEIRMEYTLKHEEHGTAVSVGEGHGRVFLEAGCVKEGHLELNRTSGIDIGRSGNQVIKIDWHLAGKGKE